ncbi:MAG: sugar ABC transporter ATP-binding protein [Ignavibacteriales bacterium]|nr:sugar ABC transporter ATP-binding protein [Ignavibacteriales bacterium]
MNSLLVMQGIVKEYPGVRALDGVDFDLQAGEVHCLVGENGAGKSTLMKILGGAVQKDAGSVSIDGQEAMISTPIDAQRLGIGIIYQDFRLVDELNVAENILLGQEPAGFGFLTVLDRKAEHKRAEEVLSQLGEVLDTHIPTGHLSAAQRQIVEIAKALSRNVRILVMDEPSASLSEHELNNLFIIIKRLKSEGVGIVYISHRLDEVFAIGDRVTVLRDGSRVHASPVGGVDRRTLIRLMVGRELEQEYPKIELRPGAEILRIENLSAGMLKNITFSVTRGEIFGIAGLVGAGRSELAHVLFGSKRKDSGKVVFDGKDFSPRSPREAIEAGLGLLTEDRNRYGLILPMNVRENISLSNLHELVRGFVIDRGTERTAAGRFTDQLKIKTPSLEVPVETLSGGNRQKVILARWLFTKSKVLIFDEPTAGIDVGAKREIYLLMNELVGRGIGVVMISSDLPELLGMCDRIAVMCLGRVTGILRRGEATQEAILSLATQFSGTEIHAG